MTPEERLEFANEFVQRYSKRLLNEKEESEYKMNKLVGTVSGLGAAGMIPMTVMLYK